MGWIPNTASLGHILSTENEEDEPLTIAEWSMAFSFYKDAYCLKHSHERDAMTSYMSRTW